MIMSYRITGLLLMGMFFCLLASVQAKSISDPAPDNKTKFSVGLKVWEKAKTKCEGNYSYKIRWSSFAGFGHETEMVVKKNKVVERRYRSFTNRPLIPGEKGPDPKKGSWTETGKDLGSHKQGAPVKTLDELYAAAGKLFEKPKTPHEREYLSFNKQGLVVSCFRVDTRIADDAPRTGIAISSITLDSDLNKLRASLAKWQHLKVKCQDNYSYKVGWSGFSLLYDTTEMIIRDNKVVERRFRTFKHARAGDADLKLPQWIEKGKDIGTQKGGAAAKTLDELYAQAAKVLERKRKDFERLHLSFDAQGLIRSCFISDTRIADYSPRNIVKVSSITLEMPKKAEKPKKLHMAPNGKPFPAQWGTPPAAQTRDLRPLPGGYGRGSSTLARWIQKNLDK
jgi:hypothetical protein